MENGSISILRRHSAQLEQDFSRFLHVLCDDRTEAIDFFGEHIGFVLPRLKDLLSSVNVSSKADLEFHVTHRTMRFLGEVQTEVYLDAFSTWLSILFECGQRDASASSLLAVHTHEIIEHLLANLDECLLAKVIVAEAIDGADRER